MAEDAPKPFWDHLDELRARLVRIALVVGLVSVAFLIQPEWSQKVLLWPFEKAQEGFPALERVRLTVFSPFEVFLVDLKAALLLAVAAAFPFVVYEILAFVHPGLKPRERRAVYPYLLAGIGLFYAGSALFYRFLLPPLYGFLIRYTRDRNLLPVWNYDTVVTTEIFMLGIVGLCCQVPVVMAILGRLGILTPGFFKGKFRYLFFASVVFSAWITPTSDLVSLSLTTAALLALFGVGWLFLWISARQKAE